MGNYIVKENGRLMICWFSGTHFFKPGSSIPYSSRDFEEISVAPIDLESSAEKVKGTVWNS